MVLCCVLSQVPTRGQHLHSQIEARLLADRAGLAKFVIGSLTPSAEDEGVSRWRQWPAHRGWALGPRCTGGDTRPTAAGASSQSGHL